MTDLDTWRSVEQNHGVREAELQRHRFLVLIAVLTHLASLQLWASPQRPDAHVTVQLNLPNPRLHSQELRDELEPLLYQTAHESNVLFGELFQLNVLTPAGRGTARAGETATEQAPYSAPEYQLQVIAQQRGAGSALVLQLSRLGDSETTESFSLLGPWDANLPRLAAHAIRYLYYQYIGLENEPDGPTPQFLDEFNSSMISMVDLGHSARVFPMSIDIGPGGHIFLGALFVAVELDHLYREVAKPGSEIYTRDSTNYGVDVRVTSAGTIFARGMGEDLFVIHPDHPRHQRLRLGIANPVASTALSDGSYVATNGQRTVRAHSGRVQDLDLRAHENSYTMILAAGSDATLWTWDAVLGAALVYSATGERLDSIIPLMPEVERGAVRALRVLPDGSFVLLSTNALSRFDKLGRPIWRIESLPAPLRGDFAMIGSIAVDAERGYIYGLNATAQRMFRLVDTSLVTEPSVLDRQVLELNRQRTEAPDSRRLLEDLARLYEGAGAPGLALETRRSLLELVPFDPELNDEFNRSEGLLLANRAVQAAGRALDIRRTIGPESAAPLYTVAVQQFEQSLARLRGFPNEHEHVSSELSMFQQEFRALEAPPPRPPQVEVAGLRNIFPALIRSYRSTPAGHVRITNTIDETLNDLRVKTNFRFADFPAEAEPVLSLSPGESAEIPVYITLTPDVLNLQEDIPVMFEIQLSYRQAGSEQQLSLNRTIMMRRNTALLWDDSGKLASFITPNDEVIQNFALSVIGNAERRAFGASSRSSETARTEMSGLVSQKTTQAALLADAVGVYGIRYIEDPASPFTEVFGRSDVLDTVRFPRTTLRVRSGDCDDTASLLASLYEAVGIRTAIMTSPGHAFIAFDTEEPAANAWIYASEQREVLRHEGTLWLPIETTILEQGFPAAWEEASRLLRTHRDEIEFLPVAEQRVFYPAIPLGPSGFAVVAPSPTPVSIQAERSRDELFTGLYTRRLAQLQAELNGMLPAGAARLGTLNRVGILHARVGQSQRAQDTFQEILAVVPNHVPALINIANTELLLGQYVAAQARAEQILRARPFSVAALSIAIQSALHLGDLGTAQDRLEQMRAVDSAAAARISGTHPSLGADSGERATSGLVAPRASTLLWQIESP